MADTDLKSRIGKTASAAVAAVLSTFMYMAFNYIAAIGAAVILLLAVRLVIYKKELKTFDFNINKKLFHSLIKKQPYNIKANDFESFPWLLMSQIISLYE